ncbi:hypothetical protein GXW74_08425 [Roseomonas eburnea]|uniref:Uncharacterized protein n=1 Tax=Neoroseomonas eburnea TaxID=1346889 RepID=A0A9X9X9X4_9PROT|nr:hypothetical protein [Neoroseomonas eburnea]MBR0680510.1 hypothetical protein [Neoroseomonas eburnea]
MPQRQARAAQPTRQAAARGGSRGSRQVAARTSGRQVAGRSGGRSQQATADCTRGARCAPRAVSWQAGLAPATNMQAQSCPVGTMATLARGHSDVVRCLPL